MKTVTPHPVERREIEVQGIVQGVGFRPFVYALARRHGLDGWVRNDAAGVHVEVEGAPDELERFVNGIRTDAPPLAVIEAISCRKLAPSGERGFHIEQSRDGAAHRALISPDVATCADCLRELFDPADRRYRYPFINCTNCGPRFTITRSVPYDRAMTTMAGFPMCPECRGEYEDPLNRRFHAQPNACPVCGPQASLLKSNGEKYSVDAKNAISEAASLLQSGNILAIKGLGGYHLACDPFNAEAVHTLRRRKARQDKPFALMARNMDQVRDLCRYVSAAEETLLTSAARPIVLLDRREDASLADEIAPRQKTLGIMLAYTPLHHLLLADFGIPLLMTSGNRSDEPIAYRDSDALEQLGGIADYLLVHDRPIHMRCDDSVARVAFNSVSFTRRSRGYAPAPLTLAQGFERPLLACGGELKNTFCVAKDRHAFISHHIGDLDNMETLTSFEKGIEHYRRLFDIAPEAVAYDLHPEYLSTKHARELEEQGLPAIGIQHHHAHIASCLADNERPTDERVIGVAFDGTGYGLDGTIWGGEFFEGSIRSGFTRRAHLAYAPLPGGEAAIRRPWRAAIAHLLSIYDEETLLKLPLGVVHRAGERNVHLIARMLEHRLNTPMTSSAGRLFDSVAALAGVPGSWQVTYEGQAAIELELAASISTSATYPISFRPGANDLSVIETQPMIAAIAEDAVAGKSPSEISAKFHRTMAVSAVLMCGQIREAGGPSAVALSGGVFQNTLLFKQTVDLLSEQNFTVYRHRRVPANDGGLSLGQAVLANQRLGEG